MLLHTFRKVEEALRKSYVRPTLRSRCTYLFANLHHRDIILFLLFCEQLLKAMQIFFSLSFISNFSSFLTRSGWSN